MITYFVKGGDFVKIGQTRNLKGRLAALQVSNPYHLSVIRTTVQISEKDAHRQAAKLTQRKASEWFGITPELMDWINSLEHADPLEIPAKMITATATPYIYTDRAPKKKTSRTRVLFDLADILTPEEIANFEASAIEAGVNNLTDHFINITAIA